MPVCAYNKCGKEFIPPDARKRLYCSRPCHHKCNRERIASRKKPARVESIPTIAVNVVEVKTKASVSLFKQVITVKCECNGCATPSNTIDVVVKDDAKTITRVPDRWTVEECDGNYTVICATCMDRIEGIDPQAASFRTTVSDIVIDSGSVVIVDNKHAVCARCHCNFIKSHGLQKYCNSKCAHRSGVAAFHARQKVIRALTPKPVLIRKCVSILCDKEFVARHHNQYYCCRKCSLRNVWEQKKAIVKNVPKDFTTAGYDKVANEY